MDLAHSNGEPGVLTPTTNINVRFVSISPLQLQIKNSYSMKTSAPTQSKPMAPSLFQIASNFEDFVPAAGLKRPATASSNTPFAGLMPHPEKRKAAFNSARVENDALAAQQTRCESPARPATRSATSKKNGENGAGKPAGDSPGNPGKNKVVLEAHSAKPVNSNTFQKCRRFSFQDVGNTVTAGVAAVLILAWILTSPFLRLGAYLGDLYRARLHQK